MVSLAILVIVMTVTLSLLFAMKSFAERQQSKTAPRQTARRAVDYLAYYVGGAADMNTQNTSNNPNAVVTWYGKSSDPALTGTLKQASYNNLTSTQATAGLGELNTDVLTLAIPVNGERVAANWTAGTGQYPAAMSFNYTAGCPATGKAVPAGCTSLGDACNATLFQQATGAHLEGANTVSELLTLSDSVGQWAYYRVTGYGSSDCSKSTADPPAVMPVTTTLTSYVNPPGGQPSFTPPVTLNAGIRYVSFRVRRQNPADTESPLNLEQKQGLFDPDTDNPGTAFSQILEDVEDFQVAWLYNRAPLAASPNVFVYNVGPAASALRIPATEGGVTLTGAVPSQAGPAGVTVSAFDVTNVAGIRLTVVARSRPLRFSASKISIRGTSTAARSAINFRPEAEDRTQGDPDGFDHHRVTTTMLIRNRMLGN